LRETTPGLSKLGEGQNSQMPVGVTLFLSALRETNSTCRVFSTIRPSDIAKVQWDYGHSADTRIFRLAARWRKYLILWWAHKDSNLGPAD
jgi:hypothetical protein